MVVTRSATASVSDLLSAFRLVLLGGARQTGKTTLVRELLDLPASARISLDDPATLRSALHDPTGLLEALPRPAAIDEFQRGGEGLLLAVKQAADLDDRRGQLLLTGSANYLADRSVSETLAGRVGRLVLWPLSVGERRGVRETFVDHLLSPEVWPPPPPEPVGRSELVEMILAGGYPEVVTQGLRGRSRRAWFDEYVQDVVSREALRPMAEIRRENELRTVLRLLAARTSGELVVSGLAQDADLNRATTSTYVGLLHSLYLVTSLPAWSTNHTTRAKRRGKSVLVDSGLAADLVGAGEADFAATADGRIAGALFETFVITELCKQAGWSDHAVDLHHFRDRDGAEIDLIVADRRTGRFAGVEIKLTSTPTSRHARTLATFRDAHPDRFTVGIVLHAGRRVLPLGDRLWAVPVGSLWRDDPAP